MKKVLFILLIMILNVGFSYADCGGDTNYSGIEGQNILITAANGPTHLIGITWSIVNPDSYPDNDVNYPAFTPNPSDCTVNFNVVESGTYTIQATNPGGTSYMDVEVFDSLPATGFGHQCYSVETRNCGDIVSFGDVEAAGLIDADNIYAYSWMHSFGEVQVGTFSLPEVILSVAGVKLTPTTITGNLGVGGQVSAVSADVTGNVDVAGRIITDELRLANCANSPRIYSNNNDIIVEIGNC